MINLLYTCDDSYLPLVSISLTSFIENNKNCFFNVYIATEKNEYTNNYNRMKEHHKEVNFVFIDCKKYDYIFEKYQLDKWGSMSFYVYWRIVAPELIDIDFLYYIDTDIICLNYIKQPDIYDKACGLVLDSVHSIYNKRLKISKSFPLYNTGVMYIDVNKWKEKECTKKCLDFIVRNKKKLLLADQDIISLALKDDIFLISPIYNYFVGYDYYGIDNSFYLYDLDKKKFYTRNELNKAKKSIIFYHALNGVFGRPWEENNRSPIKEKYNFYVKKSAWPNFVKTPSKTYILKLENLFEYIFPKKIYFLLHKLFIKLYVILKTS